MSLRVWLPLNGTLDNQGLDDIVVTNNGATVDNSGKIGKCYNFDGSNDYISFPYSFPSEDWSYSIWFYTTATTTQTLGCCRSAGGLGFSVFLISNKIRIDGIINNSNQEWTTTYIYPINTWINLIITSKNGLIKYYINGEYQTSKIITVNNTKLGNLFSIGASQTNGSSLGNYFKGKINDVRIYDHALSSMEIKQISQGLILHYPLNNNGWGQENLLLNSNIEKSGASNVAQWFRWNIAESPLVANQYYTLSFDAKITVPTDVFYIGFAQNDSTQEVLQQGVQVISEYKRYIFTGKTTKTNINSIIISNYKNYGRGNSNNTTGTLYIKNIKLELGQKTTPWCPNEADELYNKLEINEDTQYDTSGYKNNGTKTGTFTYGSDTPKYNVSTVFNKASYINIGQQLFNARDEITVNLWVKADSWATNPGNFFSSVESGGCGWQKTSNIYKVLCGTGVSSNTYITVTITTTSLDASQWHMMSFTYDGKVLNTYIDAVLQTTTSKYETKTPLYYNSKTTMFIGGEATTNKNTPANSSTYPNFKGKISDVRIYCTALSAEDIVSLYNNSAYIDNQGNIYGAIYEEV